MTDVDIKAKQQIVEKIKSSTNILVIVGKHPTVDDLASAIGLTALLNKLGKHTTAIFSGMLPPTISFLDPTKVFESTVDSLRDFIIALDKEKADHLRYKIEGDSVKIFITPYRTTISDKDLEFSQGDYNVELVLALGVSGKDNLDFALASHKQVLNDAPVMTFCAGEQTSDLGSISWRDENASSLSEMIMSVSESLKTDKPLLDKQISTSLLTGIVSATERFSNKRTTSKVMTMAAQLMAAGADQQLISARLREDHEVNPKTTKITEDVKPELTIPKGDVSDKIETPVTSAQINSKNTAAPEEAPEVPEKVEEATPATPPLPVGTLVVDHDTLDTKDTPLKEEPKPEPATVKPEPVAPKPSIPQPVMPTPTPVPVPTPMQMPAMKPEVVPEPIKTIQPTSDFINTLASTVNNSAPAVNNQNNASQAPPAREMIPPSPFQTSVQAPAPAQDHVTQSHSYLDDSSTTDTSGSVYGVTPSDDAKDTDIFASSPMSTLPPITHSFDLPMPPPLPDFSSISNEATDFNLPISSDAPLPDTNPQNSNEPSNPGQFQIPS